MVKKNRKQNRKLMKGGEDGLSLVGFVVVVVVVGGCLWAFIKFLMSLNHRTMQQDLRQVAQLADEGQEIALRVGARHTEWSPPLKPDEDDMWSLQQAMDKLDAMDWGMREKLGQYSRSRSSSASL